MEFAEDVSAKLYGKRLHKNKFVRKKRIYEKEIKFI